MVAKRKGNRTKKERLYKNGGNEKGLTRTIRAYKEWLGRKKAKGKDLLENINKRVKSFFLPTEREKVEKFEKPIVEDINTIINDINRHNIVNIDGRKINKIGKIDDELRLVVNTSSKDRYLIFIVIYNKTHFLDKNKHFVFFGKVNEYKNTKNINKKIRAGIFIKDSDYEILKKNEKLEIDMFYAFDLIAHMFETSTISHEEIIANPEIYTHEKIEQAISDRLDIYVENNPHIKQFIISDTGSGPLVIDYERADKKQMSRTLSRGLSNGARASRSSQKKRSSILSSSQAAAV